MKIKISFLLIIFCVLLALNNMFVNFILYLLCLLCHEYSHYYVAKKLGYNIDNMYLTPFGATISVNDNVFYANHEVIIALSGPMLNFIILLLIIACWWLFPQTYEYTYYLCQCNFMLCFFNLLPIYPLDGSKILAHYLNKITKNTKIILIAINIFFSVIFVILFFIYRNISLILMVCLFMLSLCEKQSNFKPNILNKTNNNSVLTMNTLVVNENIPIYKLNKLLKENCLNEFYVVNNNFEITKRINQNELYNIFVKNDSITKIKDIV